MSASRPRPWERVAGRLRRPSQPSSVAPVAVPQPAVVAVHEVPDRRILAAPELDARLRSHGFVVLSLFDPAEALAITEQYLALDGSDPRTEGRDHHELLSDDLERKRSVQDVLLPRFERTASERFVAYAPRATAFITKPSGESGDSEPHMDPSFVDELATRSIMIWCSLTGVERGGGLLWFVPGSHRLGPRRRAHLDPTNSFVELVDAITTGLGVPVELAPGEAVVFDHSTMHWADANTSGTTRMVAQSALVAEEAQLQYVYALGPGRGRVYDVDDDFYLSFPLDRQPSEELLAGYVAAIDVDLATSRADRSAFECGAPAT